MCTETIVSCQPTRMYAMKKITALASLLFSLIGSSWAGDGQWQALNYSSDVAGLDSNPLRGFIPYEGSYAGFPHSMEYFNLPLRSLMSGPDSFDWSALEQHLNTIAQRGHQAVLRIQLDTPGEPTGIPQYLLDAGLTTYRYDDYDNNGISLMPDWNDSRLIDALGRFIAAFGARYDGDARIGFVTAGLYGFWGEWHTYPYDTRGMNDANRTLLLQAYQQAFHKSHIQLRVPASSDSALLDRFGYHDDMYADSTIGSTDWHFWPTLGAAGLSNIWQTRPIGGEVAPPLQDSLFNQWPNNIGQSFTQATYTTHASWLLNHWLFATGASNGTVYNNALQAHRQLGYQLSAAAARVPDSASGAPLLAEVQLRNDGVAPFYYNWPVSIAAINGNGNIVKQWQADWSLPAIQPGSVVTRRLEIAAPALPDGDYRLVMQIANPLGNAQPVKLANLEQDRDASGWLTLQAFRVGAGGNVVAPPPVAAPLLLDDFNRSKYATNALGQWTGGNSFANGKGAGQFANGALTLAYRNDGYFGSSIGRSLAGYQALVLRIRGGAGGEQQHFHLALGGISRLFASLTPQAIGTSYQTIRIPFSAFGSELKLQTVDALQLTFWDGYSGKIEIDSIQFE